ncbi:MAG: hypothetical protein HC942_13790, partial [Microcoleus sp. SU_5_6]|nr:hypothetical protein [Microcoleus sp. SU_5_6]
RSKPDTDTTSTIIFQATGNFTAANFSYSAIDNLGATSPATASVSAILATLTPVNQPPIANNVNFNIVPSGSIRVTGLGGSDPDGSIASYTINTLPPTNQGVLYIGDPANGGIPVTAGQSLTPEQLQQLFFQATGDFTAADFSYSAIDNLGATSPATATVSAILGPIAPTPTPIAPTPTPIATTRIPEPEIDCGCGETLENALITFQPPVQPPAAVFNRPSRAGSKKISLGKRSPRCDRGWQCQRTNRRFPGQRLAVGRRRRR